MIPKQDNCGIVLSCSVCGVPSSIKQGNQYLCDKHYRFGQMRSGAKRHNKVVPSKEDMEQMLGVDLICPDCHKQMNWRSRDGSSDAVATLQHYRDGSMAIVCRSCNTRHAFMEGDTYREMPKDHKQCPHCKQIKLLSEFTLDSSRSGSAKRKSNCRQCSDRKVNQWKEANRDKYNEYQRNYRARRKAEGNPIGRKS